jgi:hypothetical protein
VASLLNPCNCKSVWRCKCRTSSASSSKQPRSLDALALAAAMCCGETSTPSSVTHGADTKCPSDNPTTPSHRGQNCGGSARTPGPELPPIYLDSAPSSMPSIPTFPTMPPLSTIASLAGSGCTCGVHCACPGCVEHRGSEHASKQRRDCSDGCGTCVDYSLGTALPNSESGTNFLDKFFAQAAALPAPPVNRKMGAGMNLDPMNVMIYPDAARDAGERGVAFGLISVPKMECCGGRCDCPSGTCGCGKSCGGHCSESEKKSTREQSISSTPEGTSSVQEPLTMTGCPGGTCGCGKSCGRRCSEHGKGGAQERQMPSAPEGASVQKPLATVGSPVLRSCCSGKRTDVSAS